MRKLFNTSLILFLIPMISFAGKPNQLTGKWYSPKLDRVVFVDENRDNIIIDFNDRYTHRDKLIFHQVNRNKYRANGGKLIQVLDIDRIKYTDKRKHTSLLLVRQNNRNNHYGDWNNYDNNTYRERYRSYEGIWQNRKVRKDLLIDFDRDHMRAKIEGSHQWTIYHLDRHNEFVNDNGDRLILENGTITWIDKRNRERLVWRRH
jgi:hypothetical protein